MNIIKEYLEFKQVENKGKTKRFNVISKLHGSLLGRISWYGSWRQYAFSPAYPTIWNDICLKDIVDFIEQLNKDHKNE